jgi:NhaP-type Na+/H+ or K+/H+ antiporter
LIVIGIFSLAGALVGADIALWPWEDPISLPIPTVVGLIVGFLSGVLIVWAIRRVEEL